MRYVLLFGVGFLCAGMFHHFDVSSHSRVVGTQTSDPSERASKIDNLEGNSLHNHNETYFYVSGIATSSSTDIKNVDITPTKMTLPTVQFQWSNIWYYLQGEPYIKGVETRLSLEPNPNRDYLQLQRDASQWIVGKGAKDWNTGYRSVFLKLIASDVLLSAQEHDLYPSVIFAQSILESGWGRSRLAVKYNNLFGIKGYNTDHKVRTTTYEKINGRRVAHKTSFRVFSSWGEAIQYHGDLLSTDSRYQHAAQAQSYDEYIKLIAEQYASEPEYADLVVQLVEHYDLDRWDAFFIPRHGDGIRQIVGEDLFGSNYHKDQNFSFIQKSY